MPKQKVEKVVRCASFIPGGDQCVLEMYHTGKCKYEGVPFSKYITQPSHKKVVAQVLAALKK